MALWRVLDKTSGSLTRAVKHPPQNHTTQRKNKKGNEKSGFARRLSAKPRFFLLPDTLNYALFLRRICRQIRAKRATRPIK